MAEKDNVFGKELRRLRREGSLKYTQNELAHLAGVTAGYISQLENGNKRPTPNVIHKLSTHLAVKPNHLLKLIGMVEMDIAQTYLDNREKVTGQMPNLTADQIEEVANYLTYLDFKVSVLK
jgi:transcriptional regulator with XRE-family HTH domain